MAERQSNIELSRRSDRIQQHMYHTVLTSFSILVSPDQSSTMDSNWGVNWGVGMALHKLTSRKIATATQGKYEDGGGLRLVVSKRHAKSWIFRFMLNKKRREMGLGPYPVVSLAAAREKAHTARQLLLAGIDPILERKDHIKIPTFADCAVNYIGSMKDEWKNHKHASQWSSTIKSYANPKFGKKPVNQITTEDVLSALKPIWLNKTVTARRLQNRIKKVLDYAAAKGYRSRENPAAWDGNLSDLLPKPSKVAKKAHHPAMPYSIAPAFIKEIKECDSLSSQALRFLILTATRTSEVLMATWSEIDFKGNRWSIPETRMKSGRAHNVPLSTVSIGLLQTLPRIKGNDFLFAGYKKGTPLSNMAMLKFMRSRGYGNKGERAGYVPHGFRSTFRDWAGEETAFPRDVCEMALAHAIKNKAEAAYRRGDLFEKRRIMMQAWADYLYANAEENHH